MAHFQLNGIKFGYEEIEVNILILLFSMLYLVKGNYCCFTDCIKSFNVGMRWDICEPV